MSGGNYAILPASIRYNKELSDSEKLLFCEITALSSKNGYCFATNKYLSELYNVSTNTISRRINNLKDKGFFKVVLIKKEHSEQILERRIYPIFDKSVPIINSDDTPPQSWGEGVDDSGESPPLRNGEGNILSINNLNNNIGDCESNDQIIENLFNHFYDEYDKKKAKPAALKAFKKAIKKHSFEEIMNGVQKIKFETPDKKFRPYPATFLNQERYLDEIETNEAAGDSDDYMSGW